MSNLYPLKFEPIFLEKIWGGNRMKTLLNKNYGLLPNCGESWEISGVEGNISVVSNGFLKGNNLQEIIEIYMGDIVGDKVYKKFGMEFPLLIKFIDAQDDLSVQVHPNDELSKKRHNAYGKTEMWYVVDAEKGAKINTGFNQEISKQKYLEFAEKGKLMDLLCWEESEVGDVYFIPAGRIHAIGRGILVAEIQQTSDVTYRIFDYNRTDASGNLRELHTELAIDALDYSYQEGGYKTKYELEPNQAAELANCDYFTCNLIEMNTAIERDFYKLDSFIIYMNIGGEFIIEYQDGKENVKTGETVLIPASLEAFRITPISESVKCLEVYIK